jgi:hypothetical protein
MSTCRPGPALLAGKTRTGRLDGATSGRRMHIGSPAPARRESGSIGEVVWGRRICPERRNSVEGQLGLGRGPSRVEVRSRRAEAEVRQDPRNARSRRHRRHDRHPSGAASTREDVLEEHPPDERRPGEPSRPLRGLGTRGRDWVSRCRSRIVPFRRHDLGPRREGRGQDAMVAGQMRARSRHDGHEPLDELVGREPKGGRAVAQRTFEL